MNATTSILTRTTGRNLGSIAILVATVACQPVAEARSPLQRAGQSLRPLGGIQWLATDHDRQPREVSQTGPRVPDSWLKWRVATVLDAHGLRRSVGVRVADQIVEVDGTVESVALRDALIQDLKRIPGIARLDNAIDVSEPEVKP